MMGNSVVGVLLYCVEPLLFYYYKSVGGAHTGPWRSFRGSEAARWTYYRLQNSRDCKYSYHQQAHNIISRESRIDIAC